MKKRLLAVLLALTLALGLLPGTVWAEDAITVYFTISDQSCVSQAAAGVGMGNGGVQMTQVPVTVPAEGGCATVDAALSAAHAQYLTADGYAQNDGWVNRFWNVETSNVLFFVNNQALPSGVAIDQLSDGDDLTAVFVADTDYWMDYYAYFDAPRISTVAGLPVSLHLQGYMAAWGTGYLEKDLEDIPLYTVDGGAFQDLMVATDQQGTASVAFPGAGTYTVSAQGFESDYDAPITAPVCTVTVYEDTPQGRVSAALDNLTASSLLSGNASLDTLTRNLTLPAPTCAGTAIRWTLDSPDSNVIGYYPDYGGDYLTTVYIGDAKAAPVTAVLTAEISSTETPAAGQSKTFSLTVPAAASSDQKTGVVHYGDVMRGIAANWQDSDPATSQIADTDLPWAVIDLQAYGSALDSAEQARYEALLNADSYGTPNRDLAKYILAEAALGNAVTAPADGGDQWSAPSILLARRAAGETDSPLALSAMTGYLSGTELDVDTAAAMLPALAPYYETDTAVKSAVDRAVSWLSARQSSGGTWSSNSNSTAMVIVGLASLGIDAHTDSRFIKDHKSAVEGLLTFALADNSGFGYGGNVLYNGMSTEQGFRALTAYARFKETGGAYNLYLQAKDSTAAAAAPNITATTVPSGGDGGSGSSTVSVAFTLQGDEPHGSAGHAAYTTWISRESYTLPRNSTVAELLNAAIDRHGFAVESSGGYVSAVTWNGTTLAERDNGPYSGWMFTVNGKFTSTGMNDTVLHGGDSVVWRYVDDYTTEAAWNDDGSGRPEEEKPEETAQLSFPDVPADAWYAEAVEAVTAAGLFSGYGDGTFGPGDSVTRGQLALILYRLADKPAVTGNSAFTDSADWCGDALVWLAQSGIGRGYSETLFGTAGLLTREQLAAFLYRYAKYSRLETTASADLSGYMGETDLLDADAMAWAVGSGLLESPTAALPPKAPVTRAELAAVLQRLLALCAR